MTAVVDTHVHVIAEDEAAYPLDPSGATGAWYRDDPCTVERLVRLLDAHDVGSAVLVQAISAYRFDNRYALDAAAAHPGRTTAVACPDLAGPDPGAEATRLVEAGRAACGGSRSTTVASRSRPRCGPRRRRRACPSS